MGNSERVLRLVTAGVSAGGKETKCAHFKWLEMYDSTVILGEMCDFSSF